MKYVQNMSWTTTAKQRRNYESEQKKKLFPQKYINDPVTAACDCFFSFFLNSDTGKKLNKFLINEEEKENMSEMGNILGVKHFIKIQCNCDRELIHHSVHLLYNKRYSTETRYIFHTDWNRKKTTVVRTTTFVIQLSFFTYKMNPNEGILHSFCATK